MDAAIKSTHSTMQSTPQHIDAAAPGAKDPGPNPNDVTMVIKNLRQTHSDWGRRKNDYRGCLQKSESHVSTKDSHIEQELRSIVDQGDALDAKLMEHNVVYIATGDLEDVDKELVKTAAAALFKLCKVGNSKMSALKTCMKS